MVEYGEFYIKSIHRYKTPRFVQKEGEMYKNSHFNSAERPRHFYNIFSK